MCENTSWKIPVWLTDSYLEEVLKDYLKDNQVKILNVVIKPATANGDNYASVMSRITVKYVSSKTDTSDLSFLIKYSYESDPVIANIMNGYDFYNTEMKMYAKILLQFSEILKEAGDNEKLFAEPMKVDFERSAIIFEDLAVNEYILADRLRGMNEEHARLTLRKLAKFHAASLVLNKRLNGELEQFQRGIFNRHNPGFGCVFENLIQICAKFAETCPELGTYYHDKLILLKEKVVEYGTRAYTGNSNQFYVLNHGDLWINNIMMQYDQKKSLKDVLLIDFQVSNWSSPAVDLHYFFNTSLEPKLQLDSKALDQLTQYYYKILTDTLRKIKYRGYVPTLHEFHIQMEEGKFVALATALGSQPIMINDQCEDADFHSLIDENDRGRNFRAKLYRNKRVQDIVKALLPQFDCHGLLDVNEEF